MVSFVVVLRFSNMYTVQYTRDAHVQHKHGTVSDIEKTTQLTKSFGIRSENVITTVVVRVSTVTIKYVAKKNEISI